jgi:signal transduction histidine kinase/CheY-like chemotaxis protein
VDGGRKLAALKAGKLGLVAAALVCAGALAQETVPLQRAASRRAGDFSPAMLGQTIRVHGAVAGPPILFPFYAQIAIQDDSGNGLVLEGAPQKFAVLQPGDRIEAQGSLERRSGLPVLLPARLAVLSHGSAPTPSPVSVEKAQDLRRLGTLVQVDGRVAGRGENSGGEYLILGDSKKGLKVFLPAPNEPGNTQLSRFDIGDHVRVTGIAAQYCPFPPFNRDFEVLVGSNDAVILLNRRWLIPPEFFALCLAGLAVTLWLWWLRGRRLASHRAMVSTFYSLGEEMIGAASPEDVLRKLRAVLTPALQVRSLHLYLHNRSTRALDRVAAGEMDFSIPLYPSENTLPLGAAACFRNQALLAIPDTRRSPFFPDGRRSEAPRSVLFVPMFAESEAIGVLELSDPRPCRSFTSEQRVLLQHLGNQIGIALRLGEEKNVREQLFRSEKLAAVGQLISGIATELRVPLDNITQLTDAAGNAPGGWVWDHLPAISGEAKKASEIVSRLVSLIQPEQAEIRRVDLNTLLGSLIEFRRSEWTSRGFEIVIDLCPNPIMVLGSQGQLDRVFLDLLIQAEQSLAEAREKVLRIGTSVLARRALVEIHYAMNPLRARRDGATDEVSALPGEGVSRGIVRSHGGELRLVRMADGDCRIEMDLPVAPERVAGEEGAPVRQFTCLVVDPDQGGRGQLVKLLTNRGCRVIPAMGPEDGAELVERMRFDVVFCSMAVEGMNWIQFSEGIRARTGGFVLLSEGYDFELSRGFLAPGMQALTKPVSEADLDRVLATVDARLSGIEAAPMPTLEVVRPLRETRRASGF